MKIRSWMIGLAAVIMVALGSCAVTDMDQTVDFTQYRTYGWGSSEVEADNPVFRSELIDKRIRNTVETEFARKGLTYADANPDLLVSYRTYTEQKEKPLTPAYRYPYFMPFSPWFPMSAFYFRGFPYGWGYPYMPMPPEQSTYTVTEGTLVVDISDAGTGELIWRGSVKGNVDNTNALARQIEKGVRAIARKYPV